MYKSLTVSFIFASLAIICYFCPEMSNATCIMTKSPGYPLPTPKDPTNHSQSDCAEGFFCNKFDPGNISTYPVFCPPTPECALNRSIGKECEMSMGTYEPRLCKKKHYCPKVLGPRGQRVMEDVYVVTDPYALELPCPKGYFCPQGTRTPLKCPYLSVCDEMTIGVRYYGSFVVLGVMIIILILALLLYRTKLYKSNLPFNFEDATLSHDEKTVAEEIAPSAKYNQPVARKEENEDTSVVDIPASTITAKLKVLAHGFKKSRGDSNPLRIKFRNVKLFVPIPKGRNSRRGMKPSEDEERPGYRQVLCGCTGDLMPGKVTAILGPSGAGKSVLFKLLLGRIPDNWQMEGTLSVNGDDSPNVVRDYRPRMGFVPQSDILHRELTVGQNINFSAQLRLSSDWTDEEKRYLVAAVVDNMRLTGQKDIPIGDEQNRGVSGGQRRRTSIGCELAAAPLALFLDEPTNGLDSSTALEVCNCLGEIAREASVTVVMIIHQPRQEIWDALDTVLFLTKGALTAYEGPQTMARSYFETICGVNFPVDSNPADVILDAIVADGKRLAGLWEENMLSFFQEKEEEEVAVMKETHHAYTTASFMCQFVQVHCRSLYKQLGDIQLLMVESGINILAGTIIGLSMKKVPIVSSIKEYTPIESSPYDVFYPQIFMYSVQSIALSASTTSVGLFGPNRYLYLHEASSGCNRLAFFLGSICSLLFRTLFIAILFTAIFQIISGFYIDFWELMLITFLLIHCGYALGLIIINFLEVKDASLVAAVLSAGFGCFSGYIPLPNWLKYLSFGFWYANSLGDMFYQPTSYVYRRWLDTWGYFEDSRSMVFGALAAYAVGMYALSFLCMIWIDRDKQR
eukprot:Tbor_TRINITY_DN6088_c0_g1::TRINITY_DN6088_c0_g1_i5::g.10828::m.10828